MGEFYGHGQIYTVTAHMDDSEWSFGSESFEGSQAFSNAIDYFESLKSYPDAYEIWMARLDGDDWKFVERVRRTLSGGWKPISASE